MRHLAVASVRPPNFYTVTCVALSEAYPSVEATFERVLETFAFEE